MAVRIGMGGKRIWKMNLKMKKGNVSEVLFIHSIERKNFPLYCPKCRQETLIDAKDFEVTVIKGNEVKEQS